MKEVELWTDELKKLGDILEGSEVGFKEFVLEQGTAMGWTIYKDKDVHVVRSFMSDNTVFPLHQHLPSAETLIMYKGAVDIICEDDDCVPEKRAFVIGVPIHIEPGRRHKLKTFEDSRIIAVFVPPDEALADD